MDIKKALKLRYGLASFTNAELYYIISSLLDCGDFGNKIEKERLYVHLDEPHYIHFFFIQTIALTQTEDITYLHVGKFDDEFDDIEIYQSPSISSNIFSADKNYFEAFEISKFLDIKRGDGIQMQIRPATLIDGLLKLSLNPDMHVREMNQLFNVMNDDIIKKDGFRMKYEFYAGIDLETDNYKNFGGTYYLIAEPGNQTVNIYDYILIENDNKDLPGEVKFSKRKLTSKHCKDFLAGRYFQ